MKAASRANVASSFTIVKGAMIDDTHAVFATWDFARSKRQNLDRLREENFIGASTATWLRDVAKVLNRRFDPDGRDRTLVVLANNGCDLEEWKPLVLWHITRDELRRLLTQTESANGFANRFCWLAVKRSKCLPDGGAIHTVNFDDVIAELQAAVDFAKDFVEISRDLEAKKLWHQDYPALSEGKPGMLGAITGRAEAQVMRLSAIYALLDKSRLIRPEHHRAAKIGRAHV